VNYEEPLIPESVKIILLVLSVQYANLSCHHCHRLPFHIV